MDADLHYLSYNPSSWTSIFSSLSYPFPSKQAGNKKGRLQLHVHFPLVTLKYWNLALVSDGLGRVWRAYWGQWMKFTNVFYSELEEMERGWVSNIRFSVAIVKTAVRHHSTLEYPFTDEMLSHTQALMPWWRFFLAFDRHQNILEMW